MFKVNQLIGFGAKRTLLSDITFSLDAALGLFDATSGGSSVVTDGATVKRWEDQSGNSRHFIQATSTPILQTSGGPNSLPWLLFDNTGKWMDCDSAIPPVDGITAFVVAKFTSTAGYHFLLGQQRIDLSTAVMRPFEIRTNLGATSETFIEGGMGNGIGGASAALGAATWGLFTCMHDTVRSSVRLNGTAALPSVTSHWGGTDGNRWRIGARESGTNLNGGLAEVRYYNRLLTLLEIQAIEDVLGAKYGITVTH